MAWIWEHYPHSMGLMWRLKYSKRFMWTPLLPVLLFLPVFLAVRFYFERFSKPQICTAAEYSNNGSRTDYSLIHFLVSTINQELARALPPLDSQGNMFLRGQIKIIHIFTIHIYHYSLLDLLLDWQITDLPFESGCFQLKIQCLYGFIKIFCYWFILRWSVS